MALLNARNCWSTIVTEFATCSPELVCQPIVSVKSNQGHIPYSNLIKFNELVMHQSTIDINSWVKINYIVL